MTDSPRVTPSDMAHGHARPALPGSLVGFGDPVIDVLSRVSEAFLASISADEGGSVLVSESEMAALRADAIAHPDTNGAEARCCIRVSL